MLWFALTCSILGLMLGPLLIAFGQKHAALHHFFSGFVCGVIPTLLLVHLLPHVWAELGIAAIGFVLVGYVSFYWLERKYSFGHSHSGTAIVLPILLLHAFTDGAGLAVANLASKNNPSLGFSLGLSLAGHRIPEGLLLASTMVFSKGWAKTLFSLACMAMATILGAYTGHFIFGNISELLIHALIALGFGVILRMIVHRHQDEETSSAPSSLLYQVAIWLGVFSVFLLPNATLFLQKWRTIFEQLHRLFLSSVPWLLLEIALGTLLYIQLYSRLQRGSDVLSKLSLAGILIPQFASMFLCFNLLGYKVTFLYYLIYTLFACALLALTPSNSSLRALTPSPSSKSRREERRREQNEDCHLIAKNKKTEMNSNAIQDLSSPFPSPSGRGVRGEGKQLLCKESNRFYKNKPVFINAARIVLGYIGALLLVAFMSVMLHSSSIELASNSFRSSYMFASLPLLLLVPFRIPLRIAIPIVAVLRMHHFSSIATFLGLFISQCTYWTSSTSTEKNVRLSRTALELSLILLFVGLLFGLMFLWPQLSSGLPSI